MKHNRQTIVDKLMSWLGAHEGDAVHKHIVDTYNSQKPLPSGYVLKYTDAWCAATVSAAAIEVGYTDIIPTECSCKRMIEKAQKMGIWQERDDYVPKIADIVLYDWDDNNVGDNTGIPDHVGLVVTNPQNNLFQVGEGNKSDAVGLRTMTVNGRYIRGYITPKYDADVSDNVTIKPSVSPTTQKPQTKGKLGIDVSSCQTAVDFAKVKS